MSFIIFLAFLSEPFYHLQHKKLDKTRNFAAGSRAVRFCAHGNAGACAQGCEFAAATSRLCGLQGRERRGTERWRQSGDTFAVNAVLKRPFQRSRT